MRRLLILLSIVVVTIAPACGAGDPAAEAEGVRVVAAFHPLAEAAARIGGGRVDVVNVTPPGTEPHDIELTADQVDQLEDADVVLYVGAGFQPAIEAIANRRERGSVDVLAAAGGDGDDPHFWLDPDAYARGSLAIAEALAAADPEHETEYLANAEEFETELLALDAEIEAGLTNCERREIVTSHDAFGYLADRYDLEQLPVAGLSPEAEPDPDRLDDIASEIEARGATTVFYEELVSDDVARTLAREMGVETAVLSPLEGLTEEQVAAGDDYFSVMRANLAALRKALGCS